VSVIPREGLALVGESLRPMGLAAMAVASVGLLLTLGQALAAAAVAPALGGTLRVMVGLVPPVLGAALPVGLLFGLTASARAWREGGDWLALATAGRGCRTVLPAVLVLGLLAGGLQALLSHQLEPRGRQRVRQALASAAGDLRLQPGRSLAVGGALIGARQVQGRELGEVVLATGATVVAARTGSLLGSGRVSLGGGEAVSLDAQGQPAWRLAFDQAELRLDVDPPRTERAERSDGELRALIDKARAATRPAGDLRLALLRRTSLPACLPLLALLAVPLGARGARPGVAATLTVLAWWSVLRISDQSLGLLGPVLAAWAPALALGLAVAVAWLSWRSR